MAKQKQSFSDAILDDPNRFLKYAFDKDPKIKDFGDFQDAFLEAFDTKLGENAKIDSEDLIKLFETSECKDRIKENVTNEEYEKLYGDGIIIKRESTSKKNQVVTIIGERVSVTPHKWKGKSIETYNKLKPRKFSNAEVKFIKVRKQKGIKPSKITKDFNAHFSKNPRSSSSIRTKIYRLK